MTNAKHAPGPWRNDYPVIRSATGAELLHVDEHDCCTVHDARLIAAAPELLEALKALETLFAPVVKDSTQADWIDRARAVIVKVTEA